MIEKMNTPETKSDEQAARDFLFNMGSESDHQDALAKSAFLAGCKFKDEQWRERASEGFEEYFKTSALNTDDKALAMNLWQAGRAPLFAEIDRLKFSLEAVTLGTEASEVIAKIRSDFLWDKYPDKQGEMIGSPAFCLLMIRDELNRLNEIIKQKDAEIEPPCGVLTQKMMQKIGQENM